MFSVIILSVLILLILLFIFVSTSKLKNYPPGPKWLPIVGNIPQLKALLKTCGSQHLAFSKMASNYNTNVLGLKLGYNKIIVVFSFPLIKSVLMSENYTGRPDNFFMKLRCLGSRKGITGTDGTVWLEQKKFILRHLQNLGLGKNKTELKIQTEAKDLIESIRLAGGHVEIGKLVSLSMMNVLWNIVASTEKAKNDPRLNTLLNLMKQRTKLFDMFGGALNHLPWLRYLAPEKTGYNLIKDLNEKFTSFFVEIIEEHNVTWFDERDDDLIYYYITEIKRKNAQNQISSFTYEHLLMVCVDFFIAGSQTTSNTLDFAFLAMLLHPEVQRKAHHVLDQHELFGYSDRVKVPYIEAILLEVERYYTVAPFVGPRRALKDALLDGYYVPKDTTILLHTYSVCRDKEIWGDPEVFRPERFLNNDGKVVTNEALLTFGLGRRQCIGEVLAKTIIFVFFTEVLKKYEVHLVAGSKRPSGASVPGMVLSPEAYKAFFKKRNNC